MYMLYQPLIHWNRSIVYSNKYHCRAVLEYEKRAKPKLTAQVQVMEKDLVAMAQEAEKLRTEIEKTRAPSKFHFLTCM